MKELEIWKSVYGNKYLGDAKKVIRLAKKIGKILDPINAKVCPSCADPCCNQGRNVCKLETGGFAGFSKWAIKHIPCPAYSDWHRYNATKKEKKLIKNLKKLFRFDNARNGFSKKNGCAIPRFLRSYRCLHYLCPKIMYRLRGTEDYLKISKYCKEISKIRKKHGWLD